MSERVHHPLVPSVRAPVVERLRMVGSANVCPAMACSQDRQRDTKLGLTHSASSDVCGQESGTKLAAHVRMNYAKPCPCVPYMDGA